jgi:hypothetical protein
MAAVPITMPTAGKVQTNLMSYGAGIVAGLGFNVVSSITGSSLIGGAISSAVAGSLVDGVLGQVIAVNAGFAQGSRGMGALGMGNLLGGLGGQKKANGNGAGVIATI